MCFFFEWIFQGRKETTGGVINFKFNFTFHNILIYNRATFNNRIVR